MCQQQVVSVDRSKDENEKSQTAVLEYCLPEYFRGFEDKLDKHFKLAERGVTVRTEALNTDATLTTNHEHCLLDISFISLSNWVGSTCKYFKG